MPINRQTMPTSTHFVELLRTFAANFAKTRQCGSAVIRILTADGEEYIIAAAGPGPIDGFLTLDVYPDDPENDMVGTDPARRYTPTEVMIAIASIRRVELRQQAPRRGGVGFAARDPTQPAP